MKIKKCNRCHKEKSINDFCKDKNTKDGYQRWCKPCMNVAYKISRGKKKNHYNKLQEQRRKENSVKFTKWKEAQGCSFCEEDHGPCLDLHHTSDDKEHNVSNLTQYSFNKMLEEANKCIIVCANCHRKIHSGKITIGD